MQRWRRSSKQDTDLPPIEGLRPSSSRTQEDFSTGLKKLFEGDSAIVDLVFVHGLNGHRERTWTADGALAPWMSTMLPLDLPHSRVFTFGYDANVVDWRSVVSQSRVGNHAMNLLNAVATRREADNTVERPLIFLAHSMGGLVCADMLVLSRQRTELHLRSVCRATCGVVFLGTPHQGSSLAVWAEALAKSIGVLKRTNTKILDVLQRDSEVLVRIQDSFHTLVRDRSQSTLPCIDIACFYEELPVPGVGSIVTLQSAIIPGYTAIGIHRNHMDMTKFGSRSDPGYIAILGELRRWVRKLDHRGQDTRVPPMHADTRRTHVTGTERDFLYEQYSSRLNQDYSGSSHHRISPNLNRMPSPHESKMRQRDYIYEPHPSQQEQNHAGSLYRRTSSTHRNNNINYREIRSPRESGIFLDEQYDRRPGVDPSHSSRNGYGHDFSNQPMSDREVTPYKLGVPLPLGQQDGLDIPHRSSPNSTFAVHTFEVPLPQNPHFTGQEKPLRILKEELVAYTQSRYTSLHRLVLTGMGGIGKTELAIQFASSNKRKFHAVFWADATTQESLNSSLQKSIRSLRHKRNRAKWKSFNLYSVSHVNLHQPLGANGNDDTAEFLELLGTTDEPWLLVVDNMDDPDMEFVLESKIRYLDAGFIVITSRNRRAARLGKLVELEGLSVDTCAEMLQKAAQIWPPRTEEDQLHSQALVERLGCLPLAIDQAAAYITACRLSVKEYIDLFIEHTDYLLGKSAENRYQSTKTEYSDGKYDTVLKTWELSFKHIVKVSPAAGDLLHLFAFMDREHISESLFARYTFPHKEQWNAKGYFARADLNGMYVPPELVSCLTDRKKFKEACAELLKFSLVKRRVGDGSLWLHPLVHYWISSRMSKPDKLQWLLLTASFLSISMNPLQQRPALAKESESPEIYHHLRSVLAASRNVELTNSLGCLPHIMYGLPYPDDAAESWSISKQLYSMSAITGEPFLHFTTRLWELTDRCCRKPICQKENMRIIRQSVDSVDELYHSPSTRDSGSLNALLFQLAFQLGLAFETNHCDCQNGHVPSDACIDPLVSKWLPLIKDVIKEWKPLDRDPLKGHLSLEDEPRHLREIYLYAITRPAEITDVITTERQLHNGCSLFKAYPTIRRPIVSRLLDLVDWKNRPIEQRIKSLAQLLVLTHDEKLFSRLVDQSARIFNEVVMHSDTTLSDTLEPQANAMRWAQMNSFLTKYQAWERSDNIKKGLEPTKWASQWSRFLYAFNLRLGLLVDPARFYKEHAGKISLETDKLVEIDGLFREYKAPTDFDWTVHVVDFLKGFQNPIETREQAIKLLMSMAD